jgi:hypothetical protein
MAAQNSKMGLGGTNANILGQMTTERDNLYIGDNLNSEDRMMVR